MQDSKNIESVSQIFARVYIDTLSSICGKVTSQIPEQYFNISYYYDQGVIMWRALP